MTINKRRWCWRCKRRHWLRSSLGRLFCRKRLPFIVNRKTRLRTKAAPRPFEIWLGGYPGPIDWGENWAARRIGVAKGRNFHEACVRFFREHNSEFASSAYPRGAHELFDRKRLAFWGIRLYDNEAAARRLNG